MMLTGQDIPQDLAEDAVLGDFDEDNGETEIESMGEEILRENENDDIEVGDEDEDEDSGSDGTSSESDKEEDEGTHFNESPDPQQFSETKPTDEIVELTFAIYVDSAMANAVLKSDATWMDLRCIVSEKLVKPPTKLNLAYCFNTQTVAQKKIPTKIGDTIQFLEMMEEAKARKAEFTAAKAAGKKNVKVQAFKVELIDLDAGKDKEKAKLNASKSKKKVCLFETIRRAKY